MFEGRVVEDVGKYLQEGRRLAAILGPTHGQAFKIREGMIDREREQAVRCLCEGLGAGGRRYTSFFARFLTV